MIENIVAEFYLAVEKFKPWYCQILIQQHYIITYIFYSHGAITESANNNQVSASICTKYITSYMVFDLNTGQVSQIQDLTLQKVGNIKKVHGRRN